MSINEKLRQARLKAKLTQEMIAEKLGVSRQTISNWENGRSYPDIYSIITLADIYDVTLDSLLKGDEEIIMHLKESSDVTKSKTNLAKSIRDAILVTLIVGIFLFLHFFTPVGEVTSIITTSRAINTILLVVVTFGLPFGIITFIAKVVGVENIKRTNINKTLIRIGFILLYGLFYVPLIIYTPEAINYDFGIGIMWLQALIRVLVAGIFLIPAFVIYKKVKCIAS